MKIERLELLKKLCSVHSPSGNENSMTEFLTGYIQQYKSSWKIQPEIFSFQNSLLLVFGQPRTAVFAHIDNIGFMVGYENELIKIGAPAMASGQLLTGYDQYGLIECTVDIDDETNFVSAKYHREIDRGTDLSYKMNFREDEYFIQSCYLDNRLGVWTALRLAETIENGAIVFSCWEEHGGGSASCLGRELYEMYRVTQALICDITWVTKGVHHGNGVAVSIRDSGIPRRSYVNRIRKILDSKHITYQLEVESSGGSDGNELQRSPYPIDWCFVGAPEDHVHSPDEKVHKKDIISMLEAYKVLVHEL
jgi:putative aminopeptidase FrvX